VSRDELPIQLHLHVTENTRQNKQNNKIKLRQLKECYVKVVPCYHPQAALVEESLQIQTGAANIGSLFYLTTNVGHFLLFFFIVLI
jgi:hypothetical protein